MLDGLFRSTFRTKCKSLLSRTKTRLEAIKKRRNAMQKFLKKDIAELLKSNLETNAYGRKTGVCYFALLWSHLEWANITSMAEGLYMELNLSSCYEYIEQCCTFIAENLKEMHKQSECPEQCRVAVSSLTYAAARFADLPELRDLRNLFNEKYGNVLEPFSDKEFIEKIKSKPPTTQMKLHLMQEIAQEYSVTWDPSQLEKQLQSPSLSTQEKAANLFRNRSTLVHAKGKKVDGDKPINEEEIVAAKNRRRNSISGFKQNSIQEVKTSNADNKPFANKIVPSPYTISNSNTREEKGSHKNDEDEEESVSKASTKPRPRSVRTKFSKSSISMSSTSTSSSSSSSTSSEHINDPRENLSARVPQAKRGTFLSDDDEEEKVDNILSLFEKKKGLESRTPTSARKEDIGTLTFELPPPPGRRRYLFSESQVGSPEKEDSGKRIFHPPGKKQYPIRQVKSTSHLDDEAAENHVHPKMPDFDELAERIAVLKHV